MGKTETVHTRVSPEIKEQADKIFSSIGLTTSQAIMLFLTAAVNYNGIPFELTIPNKDVELEFASNIAKVEGVEPTEKGKKIMSLYQKGEIDYETAKFAMKRLYK